MALGCSISMPDRSQSNSRHVRLLTSSLLRGQRYLPLTAVNLLYRRTKPSGSHMSIFKRSAVFHRTGIRHYILDLDEVCPQLWRTARLWISSYRYYSSSGIIPIIREELLFEKISSDVVFYGILNNSTRIIFYLRFKKSGISFFDSFISTLLPNQVSFHSFSFLSTESCDISA